MFPQTTVWGSFALGALMFVKHRIVRVNDLHDNLTSNEF